MIGLLTLVTLVAVVAIAILIGTYMDDGLGAGFGAIGAILTLVIFAGVSGGESTVEREGHAACAAVNAPYAGNFNREQWCYSNASSMFRVEAP